VLTKGADYEFRYKAENIYGSSSYSPIATIKASSVPLQMVPPVLSYSVLNPLLVQITLVAPDSNGSAITSYEVQAKSKDGNYYPIQCTTLFCEVPLSVFTTNEFNNAYLDNIYIKATISDTVNFLFQVFHYKSNQLLKNPLMYQLRDT
jgi:hypothetical protein